MIARFARLLAAVGAVVSMLVLAAAPAAAHGAPTAPVSRAAACGAEGAEQESDACRAALKSSPKLADQWDNIRVADVDGRDRQVIPDGKLCSAGIPAFRGLDLGQSGWPATRLTAGENYEFGYRGTIPHKGEFRLYLTRDGYESDQPLTWSDLETEPFLSVTDPPLAGGSYTFEGRLPADRTGPQLIYTIWQNSDTPDTYYSCSDVELVGGAAVPTATVAAPEPPPAVPEAAESRPVGTVAQTGPVMGMTVAAGAALVVVLGGSGVWLARRLRRDR